MRRIGLIGLILAILLPLATKPALAQNTQDFTITNYTADYYLSRNQAKTAQLHTVEQITAVFPSFNQNHGILRAIPETYLNHTISLKIDSITDEQGNPRSYTSSGQNGNLVLKIGDANTYVHGEQTYKITYDMKNVANILGDHDELYWDVNGDQWQQPFGQVTARLHVPPDLVNSLQQRRVCYVGSYGSNDTTRCSSLSQGDSGGILISYQAQNLASRETMTFTNAFNNGTFLLGPEIHHEAVLKQAKIAGAIVAAVITPTIIGMAMYRRWRAFGNDPKGKGVIIPEYEPPKGLNVMQSDFIMLENFRSLAISALIVGMATQKFITIYEIPKKGIFGSVDYEIELVSLLPNLNKQAEQALNIIFSDNLLPGIKVKLSDLKVASNYTKYDELSKDMSSSMAELGYFVRDPVKTLRHYQTLSTLPLVGFIICIFLAIKLSFPPLLGLAIGLLISTALMSFYAKYMPARTLAGVEARNELKGLKDFIKLAEADRIKYLQSPSGAEKIQIDGLSPDVPMFKIKLFETLLPYAMIFGLEKDWAKQFKDIYTTAPDWYRGNWSTFNSIYLVNSLSGFSTASSVSFAPPASSGSSGFGGGGGAGGGGGGGGGGGW